MARPIVVERVVQHASTTDVLTAIGTVGATVLALLGIYRGWWLRPRLRMHMQIADPPNGDLDEALMAVSAAHPEGWKRESAWIRARVVCTRSSAEAVEVVLLGGHVRDGDVKETLNVAGMSLRWSGRDPPETQLPIPPGLPRHIDIASISGPVLGLVTESHEAKIVLQTLFRPFDERHMISRGEVSLSLAITSRNALPAYYALSLQHDGSWPQSESIWQHLKVISFESAPRPGESWQRKLYGPFARFWRRFRS